MGIEDTYGFVEVLANHLDGCDEVRITRDDNGGGVAVEEAVHEEVGSQVHIRAFFLGFENFNGVWGRVDDLGADFPGAKVSLDDREVGQGAESAPVDLLPGGLVRVARKGRDFSREVLRRDDGVLRECRGGQRDGVQPVVRGVLDGAVVEVEAVDVEDGFHAVTVP